jgi:hypothetical protein
MIRSKKVRFGLLLGCLPWCLLSLFVLVVVQQDSELPDMFSSNRQRVQDLLGTTLPQQIDNLQYFKHKKSSFYRSYTAYIRFRSSEDAYTDLMQRMKMNFYEGGENRLLYLLPGQWKPESDVDLDWWNLSLDIPENTATRDLSVNGWIIAKYENGYTFIKLHDPDP